MFCKNCGKSLPDGVKFCPGCGTPVTVADSTVAPNSNDNPTPSVEPTISNLPKNENSNYVAPSLEQSSKKQYTGPVYSDIPNTQQEYRNQSDNNQNPNSQAAFNSDQTVQQTPPQQYGFNSNNADSPAPIKKKKKPLIIVLVIILILAIAGIGGFLYYRSTRVVNLNDYISVEFTGYDTVGTLTFTIDDEAWKEIYDKSNMSTKSSKTEKADYAKRKLNDEISYSFDNETNLSNGDEVNLTWDIDTESIKKEFGVKILFEDVTYTVEGLEDVEVFSPFDDITVAYHGLNGDAEIAITINSDADIYSKCAFTASKTSSISVGDEITITFDYDGYNYDADDFTTYCAENFGMIPSETEKTYTVDSVGRYAQYTNDFSDDSLAELQEAAEEFIDEFEYYWEYDTSLTSAEYKGIYVQYADGSNRYFEEGNIIYLIYEITANCENSSGDNESYTFYQYVAYTDVIAHDDGYVIFDSDESVISSNIFQYDSEELDDYFKFYGYASIEDFEEDMIEPIESYVSTDSSLGGSTL